MIIQTEEEEGDSFVIWLLKMVLLTLSSCYQFEIPPKYVENTYSINILKDSIVFFPKTVTA